MKNFILYALLLGALSFQLKAQNNIILNINHKLGDEDFAIDKVAQNNFEEDFKISRIEYYISEISIIHDGGRITPINDIWILVDAASETRVDLGIHDITSVEKINLHIGVDPDHNHLDPSLYDMAHPLAPKFPSMHWGWASGYRFVALEGHGGSNLDQLVQLHGLGDNNYFSIEISLGLVAENGMVVIPIDADYSRALEDISLSSGVIVHGDTRQAKKCLENFRDYVFSSTENSSSVTHVSEVNTFNVLPNLITNGYGLIKLDVESTSRKYDVSITTLNGKQLKYINDVSDKQRVDFSDYTSGIYVVHLVKDGYCLGTQKVVVR